MTSYADHSMGSVTVVLGGREVARFPLSGQGFLVAKAGAAPQELAYAPTPEVVPELDAYFGR